MDVQHVAQPATEGAWKLAAVTALLQLLHCCIVRGPAASSGGVGGH